MELVYESFESNNSYNTILEAIDTKWIEEALFTTKNPVFDAAVYPQIKPFD